MGQACDGLTPGIAFHFKGRVVAVGFAWFRGGVLVTGGGACSKLLILEIGYL